MSQDDTIPPTSPDSRPETSEEAQLALEAVAEARRRLAEAPASVVVANHAMGLFELAAIHLSSEPPRLEESQLAIDALGLLVDGLGERLGEHHDTLVAALTNIRMVFVKRKTPPTSE
jgi:hypothetical protein